VSELSTGWHADSERRRILLVAALAIVGSLVSAALLVLAHFVSAFLVYAVLGLVVIAWRPRVGLFLAVGLVLFFEYLTEDPLMLPGRYLYSGFSGSVVSPLELLLLLSLGAWLVAGAIRHRLDFRGGRLGWQMALYAAALVFGLARGAAAGGSSYVALWEVRFLFYIAICYTIAANTIRTRRDLRALMAVVLLATAVYAIEGAYRKLALIDTGRLVQDIEDAWGHDSAIFLSNVCLLVLAQRVFGGPAWQRRLGPLLVPIVGFTLLASQRRAGNITLLVSLLVFCLVFLVAHRKAFLLIAVPLLVSGAIYFPVFWNNTGMLGQPARAVRSMISPDVRDQSSNYYRDIEKINVRATILANPLLGVGFGREFLFVIPMADLSFWQFWRYEPHNNILWVWLKTGAPGFTVFWILMGSAIVTAGHFAKTLRGPDERGFALFALGVVISSLVFCWVDTGLTYPRFTVVLGTTLGALAVLDQLDHPGALDQIRKPT
jgi:hypothetical protein